MKKLLIFFVLLFSAEALACPTAFDKVIQNSKKKRVAKKRTTKKKAPKKEVAVKEANETGLGKKEIVGIEIDMEEIRKIELERKEAVSKEAVSKEELEKREVNKKFNQALSHYNISEAEALLGMGADINAFVSGKRPPIIRSAMLHRTSSTDEMYNWLLEQKNIDVNIKDANGMSLLMALITNNQLDRIQNLVEKHPNIEVNAQDEMGYTGAMIAVDKHYWPIVNYLSTLEQFTPYARTLNGDTLYQKLFRIYSIPSNNNPVKKEEREEIRNLLITLKEKYELKRENHISERSSIFGKLKRSFF